MGAGALQVKGGRLRERVTFQRRGTKRNDFGEETTWRDITTVWAGIEPLAGREYFTALQVQSDVSTRIVCRYSSELSDVTPKDRIKHGSTVYDVRSVIDRQNRHRDLEFMCTLHVD
jgi:SPP1 family predicted phage head-tail adaptor